MSFYKTNITKFLFFFTMMMSVVHAQIYQLQNAGFEQWDGNNANDEPTHWNGFPSAACDLSGVYAIGCNAATSTRHARTTEIRPGSTGQYSCKIFATQTNIIGNVIIANGALTTGRIRIGSVSTNSDENYNITLTSQPSFSMAFNGKPDSISFWARFVCPSATQEAKMVATIHDAYNYREPETTDQASLSHIVGRALCFFNRANQNWRKHTIPFDYNYPSTQAEYILLTFSTNKEAGVGSTNDMLFIDDIEMIYNTKLSNLMVNNIGIYNFSQDVFNYQVSVPCQSSPLVTAITASPNASVQINQAGLMGDSAIITVTAGGMSSQYVVYFAYQNITTIYANICQGQGYHDSFFNVPPQTNSGVYIQTLTTYTSAQCDSVIKLILNVHPSYVADTTHFMICEGASYSFFDNILTEAGIYDTTITSVNGCDSLVTLNLSVGSYYLQQINASVCAGEIYTQHGFNTSDGGTHTLNYMAVNGCDSIVQLNLSLYPTHHVYIYDTVKPGEIYHEHGFFITDTDVAGYYEESMQLLNTYNCDSIITLKLSIVLDSTDSNFEVKLYPNPTSDLLNIQIISESFAVYLVELYNSYGKLLLLKEIYSHSESLSLKNLSAGFYILKIRSSENVFKHFKIIKT